MLGLTSGAEIHSIRALLESVFWAIVLGLIAGALFAWFYNRLVPAGD